MAKYNTFLVISTLGKPMLVTSSARKARRLLQQTGIRVEVWSANAKAEVVYYSTRHLLGKYVAAEREYIRAKQEAAERRNRRRRREYEKHSGRPEQLPV